MGSFKMALPLLLITVLLIPFTLQDEAQEPATQSPDLAMMVLSPLDDMLTDYKHVGSFDEALVDEARIMASYHGNPDQEQAFRELLEETGFNRKHISALERTGGPQNDQPERIVRSYVTVFASSEGAATAFAILEDESGIPGTRDLTPALIFGEEADLTESGGFDDQNWPFRSHDLTFRIGNLVGGVTLVTYPTERGFEPDQQEVEALGKLLEAKMTDRFPVSVGVAVSKFDPAYVVTYDDAYYRLDGRDIPLSGELEDATEARTSSYGIADTVYQVFQGLGGGSSKTMLYSLTLYEFNNEDSAAEWLAGSAETITSNDYYQNLEPDDPPVGEKSKYIHYVFGPFSSPPVARISIAQFGTIIARVQLVPDGALPQVPLELTSNLLTQQLSCLEVESCAYQQVPEEIAAYLDLSSASPEAQP